MRTVSIAKLIDISAAKARSVLNNPVATAVQR
jgi:hypothetical protein